MRILLLLLLLFAGVLHAQTDPAFPSMDVQDEDWTQSRLWQKFKLDSFPAGLPAIANVTKAEYQLNKDEADSVIALIAEADTVGNTAGYAQFLLGQAYDRKRQFEKAAAAYLRAAEMDVDIRRTSLIEAFRSYSATGNKRAHELMARLLRDYPAENDVYYFIGQYHAERERYDSARHYLAKALQIQPWNYGTHYLLGQVYVQQDQLPQAALAFATAITLQPQNETSIEALITLSHIAKAWQGEDYLMFRDSAGAFKPLMADLLPRKLESYRSRYNFDDDLIELLLMEAIFDHLKKVSNRDLTADETLYLELFNLMRNDGFEQVFLVQLYGGIDHKQLNARLEVMSAEYERMLEVLVAKLIELAYLPPNSFPDQLEAVKLRYREADALASAGNESERGDEVGQWWAFYENGYVQKTGTYNRLGHLDGTWRMYTEAGHLDQVEHYKNGRMVDTVRTYYPTGELKSQVPVHNGEFHGDEDIYYRGGELKGRHPFENGKRQGYWMDYHHDGTLSSATPYEAGLRVGLSVEYYRNGHEKQSFYFKGGLMNGPARAYHMNGNPRYVGGYENSMPSGIWTFYDLHGDLTHFITYADGVRHGITREYDPLGRLKTEKHYTNSMLDGQVLEYDSLGNVVFDARYANGTLVRYKVLSADGSVLYDVSDEDGTLPLVNFDVWGRKKETGTYINGRRERTWKTYFENGQVATLAEYERDKRVGPYLEFAPDGRITKMETYEEGERNGLLLWMQYDEQPLYAELHADDQSVGWRSNYHPNGRVHERVFEDGEGGRPFIKRFGRMGRHLKTTLDTDTGRMHFLYGSRLPNASYNETEPLKQLSIKFPEDSTQLAEAYEIAYGVFGDTEKIFHINGQLAMLNTLSHGYYHGHKNNFYPDGTRMYREAWSEGYREGESRGYQPDGSLRFICNSSADQWHGFCEYYTPDGHQSTYMPFYKDERHGRACFFNNAGDTIAILFYDFGKIQHAVCPWDSTQNVTMPRDGRSFQILFYYPDGKRAFQLDTYLNAPHGRLKRYARNGQVIDDSGFHFGEWHGAKKQYAPDGTLLLYQQFTYDVKNGEQRLYDSAGRLRYQAQHTGNTINGPTHVFDENGRKTRTYWYENNVVYRIDEY